MDSKMCASFKFGNSFKITKCAKLKPRNKFPQYGNTADINHSYYQDIIVAICITHMYIRTYIKHRDVLVYSVRVLIMWITW